jgi:serine protease Do
MTSLVENGHVTRGYMGVQIQSITPALAQQFDLKNDHGALVSDVVADGPAEKAGVKTGDVIVKFNGKEVSDSRHLQLAVAETAPDSKVPMEVIRDGSTKTLEVTIKQLKGNDEVASAETNPGDDTGTLNGVGVGDLDRQTRDQFNIPSGVNGAVVTQVDPNSAAANAGLKPGDVIEEINHHAVKSADEAVKLTEHPKSKRTLVRVWENGGSHYVVVDESKNEG